MEAEEHEQEQEQQQEQSAATQTLSNTMAVSRKENLNHRSQLISLPAPGATLIRLTSISQSKESKPCA